MYKLRLPQKVNGMLVTIDDKVRIARKLVDETGKTVDGFLEVLGGVSLHYVGWDQTILTEEFRRRIIYLKLVMLQTLEFQEDCFIE